MRFFNVCVLRDMHVHLATNPEPEFAERKMLPQFLTHGVVGVHAAGAPILAGTDTYDRSVLPGSSLHQELQLLAEAGLSPLEVLPGVHPECRDVSQRH